MDTGTGQFAPLSPSIADLLKRKSMKDKVFEVGEEVKIKDCRFWVEKIDSHTIMCRLIPDDSYQQVPR